MLFIGTFSKGYHLCFTIHEIHSYRIGPALCTWTLQTSNDIFRFPPIGKELSTNTLGITFGANCTSRCMELFELSMERGNHFNMTGQIIFDREICGIGASYVGSLWYNHIFAVQVKLSPDRTILLSADQSDNGRIGLFHSSSGNTNKMDFSFVDNKRLPNPKNTNRREMPAWAPSLVFSADGSKFATATPDGVVTIWDAQNGLHLKVYVVEVPSRVTLWPISFLQFSSGISGREVLVFMEVVDPSTLISANK